MNWEDFKKKLAEYLNLEENESTKEKMEYLKNFVSINLQISLKNFTEIIQYFGPFNSTANFLNDLSNTVSQPWFHGDISSSVSCKKKIFFK